VPINPLFGPPPLVARLRFRYAILDSLNVVAACEGAPRTCAVRFQDDVRV
jgi:hypothetical protein